MERPAEVADLESQVAALVEEVERYRSAAEDAVSQIDWCIGYFTAQKQHAIARALNANRSHIRSTLMGRSAQPLPVTSPEEGTPEVVRGGEALVPKQAGS